MAVFCSMGVFLIRLIMTLARLIDMSFLCIFFCLTVIVQLYLHMAVSTCHMMSMVSLKMYSPCDGNNILNKG